METSLPSVPPVEQHASAYIAPWWHTALLVLFLLSFSALGAGGHQGLDHSSRMKLYISTVIMEWLMVLFIVWGLRRKNQTTLSDLVGGRWKTPEDFLIDIGIAVGFWIVAALVLAGVGYLLGLNNLSHVKDMKDRVGSMLPNGR